MNINTEIFRKTKPETKVHIVNHLSNSELLAIRPETIIRMIKEAGHGKIGETRCHNKTLTLRYKIGNNYNSQVIDVSIWKKKPYINFYIQYSNTDVEDYDDLSSFLRTGDYRGCYTYKDKYDNYQTIYYNYNEEYKARVIKEILLTYLHNKYKV